MAEEDYKTKIKIESDTKGAEAGIAKTKSQLQDLSKVVATVNRQLLIDGVKQKFHVLGETVKGLLIPFKALRGAISSVMGALGVFYLAFEGFNHIKKQIENLIKLWKEYKTAAERAALASSIQKATVETNRLAEAQKSLNDQLKEQLSLQQRAASLREMRASGEKSFANEQRSVERAIELAGISDPRQRQALQDRYAREDEARSRAERNSALAGKIGTLTSEANAYSASAARAGEVEKQTAAALSNEQNILAKQRELKASKEEIEATRTRIEALGVTWEAARKEKAAFQEEAAYRRSQIQILTEQQQAFAKLGTSAEQVSAAAWQKIDAADAAANQRLSDKLAANMANDDWQRKFSAASPAEKISMLSEKEDSARGRMGQLQSALEEEMAKAVADRSESRLTELRTGIESAQGEMFSARRQREDLQEAGMATSTRQGVTIGAGSRLNAMGLGSGSGVQRVQEQMATSLRDLVNLGRDQLSALKGIKREDSSAVFS
ncbi:MAG: hypothetical protein J6V72_20800 [Kiritimatiellae bacterium]|nr:hypothetical protein [Kiritimatiellia bacterium]